jgi:hypothetical protein
MSRRRLEVEIVGDEKNLNRTLGRAENRIQRFGRSIARQRVAGLQGSSVAGGD